MKWQILVTSLVLSVAVSTQSFGFELLDRMLGINGFESKCCAEKAAKNDCSAKAKAAKNDCGAKAKAAKSDCNGKSATQKSATQKDATQKSVRSLIRKGCDDKKASDCGEKAATQKGGDKTSLLDRIFACDRDCGGKSKSSGSATQKSATQKSATQKDSKCGAEKATKCGCGASAKSAKTSKGGKAPKAPMPPAPIVDPSAYMPVQPKANVIS